MVSSPGSVRRVDRGLAPAGGLGRRRVLLGLLALLPAGVLAPACSKTNQSLALIGGETVDAELIDADPLAVLPSGALLVSDLNTAALFATPLGTYVAQVTSTLLPLGPESNFVPSRDVRRIYGAMYAMQGADFCALLQGDFDVDAIRHAARAGAPTPSGAPLVETHYAGNVIYTVANIGFVVLTSHTILSGNDTGMRRALDRLRFGKLDQHSLPAWMRQLLDKREGHFAIVGDVTDQPVVEATGEQMTFLAGLRFIRVLGNFGSPGLNVVGSLTYRDEQSATAGAQSLRQLGRLAALVSLVASLGLSRVPQLNVAQQARDVSFATSLDTTTVQVLLGLVAEGVGGSK